MKLLSFGTFYMCVALSTLPFSMAADTPQLVAVAGYHNSPEANEAVGKRVHAILLAHNIQCSAPGSLGVTVSVPADRAAEALQLLAKAIKAEKLELALFTLKGGRYITITPESVLESKKSQ